MLIDAHTHLDLYADVQVSVMLGELASDRLLTLSVAMDPPSYVRACALAQRHHLRPIIPVSNASERLPSMTTADATDAVPAIEPEHDARAPEVPANSAHLDRQAQRWGTQDPPRATGTILKVRTSSRPSAVAGAIAGVIRQVGQAELQAIGAGAINQAVKAIAIARSYLQDEAIDLWCVPSFIELVIDGEERTALRLVIEVQR